MIQKIKMSDLEMLNAALNISAMNTELPYKIAYAIGRTEVEVRSAMKPFQAIMHQKSKDLWKKYCKLDEKGDAKTKARLENNVLVQEPEFLNEEMHSKFYDEYEGMRQDYLKEEVEVDIYSQDFQALPLEEQKKYFNSGLEPYTVIQLEKNIILNVDHE